MKRLVLIAAIALPGLAHAQHDDHAAHQAAPAAAVEATGVVKKVDRKAGTAVIDHDPVKSLNGPAMTMTFKVPDPAVLAKLKPGAKVRFQIDGMTIIAVEAAESRSGR